MKNNILSKALIAVLFFGLAQLIQAQDEDVNLSGQQNIISTAVSFLDIAPESRGGAMGNAGVAISPDVNSQHWNPAKYAFIEKESGVAISYTPWLRKLVNDINLYYLTGFKRLDDMQTISASVRYFSLGDITFMSEDAMEQGSASPNEFAVDAAYSRILSDHLSGSVAFRYIRSDLQIGLSGSSGSENYQAGNSFAADLAFYYQNEIELGGNDATLAAGINISNIGSKISYDGNIEQFIPTNLRLGTALKTQLDEYNELTVALDFNKLLVPTPDNTDDQEHIIRCSK